MSAQFSIDEKMTSPPVPITAGPHEVIFTWKERTSAEQNAWEPGLRATMEIHNPSGMPRLEERRRSKGRHNGDRRKRDSEPRERVFVCRPASDGGRAILRERDRVQARSAGVPASRRVRGRRSVARFL